MNVAPRISCLMTVFNGGKFLPEAVESILAQTFRDFEFVIVDDASTDGSQAVLETYARRDPRVRLILREENSGQTACLNLGLAECRADWVARQDADDISHPRRLAAQWRAIGENPRLVLLGVNGWITDAAGRDAGMIHAPVTDAGIRWSLPFRNPFIHTGAMFRRLQPDGSPVKYDPAFRVCQDWELWSRLAGGGEVANLPERLVSYRSTGGSLSKSFSDTTRRENRLIAGKNWRANFAGRDLASGEAALLETFREGLDPGHWPSFRRFYASARNEWLLAQRTRDRQSEAMHMLQAAGALAGSAPLAAASAMLQALSTDPAWTTKNLISRFACAGRLRW